MCSSDDIKTVVFPVAGLGSRFLPATKIVAKELLPILDKPLIDYAVCEAKKAGIERFIFINSPNKQSITNYFKKNKNLESELKDKKSEHLELISKNLISENNLIEVIQDKPLGLGHAIWCARKYISGPFAVMLPDDLIISGVPCIKQLIKAYKNFKSNVVAIQEVDENNINKYGVIDYYKNESNTYHIKDMIEKPDKKNAPSNLAIIGRYILNPSIIKELSNHELGAGGEIQLTDAIKKLIINENVIGYKFEGNRFDCGNVIGALNAQLSIAMNDDKYKSQIKEIIKNLSKE
ncbi:MAG: UTP--glucose-1-phosphate uridylyltransferase [Pelagibacterales bacterium]|nr:UTP--glucose-1-phosphate uridylyltransferase [Pelagibacterales bacterium]PPR15788.1 MAG: UTP--glucose-1-phosphate uridylyltransferase [Alphaproteobacteria bacterium MarineAlpha9_Bin3]|tara:strand:- start:4519 stop:5394 length:876 start_codon:yes stop_codon:yes gene_type:complete